MRTAYFDCFAGMSGGMLLGALLGAGLPLGALKASLGRLPLSGYTLWTEVVSRKGLPGTYFGIGAEGETRNGQAALGVPYMVNSTHNDHNGHNSGRSMSSHTGDSYDESHARTPECIISKSDLPEVVKQTSIAVFRRLEQVEAAISPVVGGATKPLHNVDTVLTVVGVVAGLALLGIDRVECSPLHVGSGLARTSRGIGPVLSPVTLELLRVGGVPVYGGHLSEEAVAPACAAIITTISSRFGPMPAMKICSVGYGAGKHDFAAAPNLVRLLVGETVTNEASSPWREEHGGREGFSPVAALAGGSLNAADSQAFVASREEWVSLAIQGHQQNGRQRAGSR